MNWFKRTFGSKKQEETRIPGYPDTRIPGTGRSRRLTSYLLPLTTALATGFLMIHTAAVVSAPTTFIQAAWNGGQDSDPAGGGTLPTGWTQYRLVDAGVIPGATNIQLQSSSYTALQTSQDGSADTPAGGSGFNGGTKTNAAVSGTGSGASVKLGPPVFDAGTGTETFDFTSAAYATVCSGTGRTWTAGTSTCTINTATTNKTTNGTYEFTTVNIPAGVTVTASGTNPLIIKATGNVTIAGILDLNGGAGSGATAGAGGGGGGYAGGNGAAGSGGGGAGPGGGGGACSGQFSAGGGGGAGYSGAGSSGNGGCPGGGGAAYGNAQLTTLYGGSGGGGASQNTGANGGGGGGGGALKITTQGTMTISGSVTANGGAGGASTYWGGDGSGGSIFLQGGTINISGTVTAVGGTGVIAGSVGRIRLDYGTLNNSGTISPAAGYTVLYTSSGTFESATINLGGTTYNLDTLSWNAMIPSAANGAGMEIPSTTTGLVQSWHLNSVSSGTTTDSKGSYTGTLGTGTIGDGAEPALNTSNPKLGVGALTFDGTADYVFAPATAISGSAGSAEMWIRFGDPSMTANQDKIFWSMYTSATDRIALEIESFAAGSATPEFSAVVNNQTVISSYTTTGVNPTDMAWHYVVVVWGDAGTYKLYVDGKLAGSSSFTAFTPTTQLLGAYNAGTPAYFFKGDIDEVAIYSRALTSDEIAAHYASLKFQIAASNCSNGADNAPTCSTNVGWGDTDTPYVGPGSGSGDVNTYFLPLTKPKAVWHFNETSGGTASDDSGNGYSGTLTSGATGTNTTVDAMRETTVKKLGAASIEFDGDDYVSAPDIFTSAPSTITVSAWVYATAWNVNQVIVEKGLSNQEWALFSESDSLIKWRGASATNIVTCAAPSAGAWHHIAVTQAGNSSTALMYIDRVKCGTGTGTIVLGDTTASVYVGAFKSGAESVYYFNGKIDEVAVYDTALSAQEITLLYKDGAGRETPFWTIPSGLNTPLKQYVRYKAYLATGDVSATPQLDDLTIGYSGYPSSAGLTSSKFDSAASGNLIKKVIWDQAGTANGTVTVSLRSATANAGLTGAWADFAQGTTGCTGTGDATVTCTIQPGSALLDANDDRWFQYKVGLTSVGGGTPTASNVKVEYDTPRFDITSASGTTVTAGVAHPITITAKDSAGVTLISANGYTNYGTVSTPQITITASAGPASAKGTPVISKDNDCADADGDNYAFSSSAVQKLADGTATNFSTFSSGAMTVYGCFYDAGDSFNLTSAETNGISNTPTPLALTVAAAAVSASNSTATATSPFTAGSAGSTVTVTLKDAYGNVRSGKTVTISSSRGATDTIVPASGGSDVTNSSGVATFTMTSGVSGTATLTATDTTDSIVLTQTPAVTVNPGAITPAVTHASLVAGATSNTTIAFTATNPIPVNGDIQVTFGSGFDISGAVYSSGNTGSSVGAVGQVLTINLGTAVSASGAVSIVVSGIKNPTVIGSGGTYAVETQNATDVQIDGGTASANTMTAGAISPTITHTSLVAGATATKTIAFTANNPIPVNGDVQITFPSGFDISGAGYVSGNSGATVSAASQVLTINLGTAVSSGGSVSIVLSGIKNPTVTGTTGTFAVETQNASDVKSDEGTDPAVTITAGAISPTMTHATLVAGATGNATIAFTATNPIAQNGDIQITLSSGFDITGAGYSSGNTSSTVSISGQVLTINVGTAISSGGAVSIVLSGIKNPTVTGSTGTYAVETQSATDVQIDGGTAGANTITAGAISPTMTHASLYAGTVSNVTVAFTATNPIPANGDIQITFPAGFDISGAGYSSGNATSTVSILGQVLTINLGNAYSAGGAVSIVVSGIRNPLGTGSGGTYAVETQNASDVKIDEGTASANTFIAGVLSSTNVQPASLVAGATGNATVTFTTQGAIPNNGYIQVTFPSGFNVSGVTGASSATDINGGLTTTITGQVVKITRNGAGTAVGAAAVVDDLVIAGVKNPTVTGSTGTYKIETFYANDAIIDDDTTVPAAADTITAGAISPTITHASLAAGSTSNTTVAFTATNPIAVNGDIQVTFPSGFDISAAAYSSGNASSTVSVASQVLTINLGTAVSAGGSVSVVLSGIKNPLLTGSAGTYAVETQNASDVKSDEGTASANTITAGIISPTLTHSSLVAGATANKTIAFTAVNPIPVNGDIQVTFPSGFDISLAAYSSGNTGSIATPSSQVLTINLGTAVSAGGAVSIVVSGIKNPTVTGTTGTFAVESQNASDVQIDAGTAAAGTITAGSLSSLSVSHVSSIVTQTSNTTIAFTTVNPVAAGGKVVVTFDSDFSFSSPSFISGNSGSTVSGSTNVLTVTLGTAVNANTAVSLVVGGVVNPTAPQTTSTYAIATKTSGDVDIDTGTAAGNNFTTSFTISAPATGATWFAGKAQTISWASIGTVATVDLSYAVETDAYASFTSIVTDCAVAGGQTCGFGNAAGNYSWTIPAGIVPSPQSDRDILVKVKVADSDAGHPAASVTSGAFTAQWHRITWVIQDVNLYAVPTLNVAETATGSFSTPSPTNPPDKPAWNVTDNSLSGGAVRYYPDNSAASGQSKYTTIWSRVENGVTYSTASNNWTAEQDKTVTLTMDTAATAAIEYKVEINSVYNSSDDTISISSWLTQKGSQIALTDANSNISVQVFNAANAAAPLAPGELGTNKTPNAQGVYSNVVFGPGIDPSITYNIKVVITTYSPLPDSKTYTAISGFVSPSVYTYEAKIGAMYNNANDSVGANIWLDRAGTTVTDPGILTFNVYNSTGTLVPNPAPGTQPADYNSKLAGGIYSNIEFNPAGALSSNEIYTIKASIEYRGKTYNAVASFSKGELGAIQSGIGGLQTQIGSQTTTLQSDIAGQTTTLQSSLTGQTTTLQGNISNQTTTLSNKIGAVDTELDTLPSAVSSTVKTDMTAQLAKGIQAELLTRPADVATGATVPIRFRTTSGLSPKITVYDPNGTAQVSAAAMKEISTTGIYEYKLTLNTAWGLGDFTVLVSESTKGSTDSLILHVGLGGMDELYSKVTSGTTGSSGVTLDTIFGTVTTVQSNTTGLSSDITSLLTRLGKATDSEGASTVFGKLAAIDASSGNEEAILAGVDEVKNYVDTLEASLGSSADAMSAETIFGRLAEMEDLMKNLGASSKEVEDAKAKANTLAQLMEEIKADLANGNMAEASAKLAALGQGLTSLNSDLSGLPATAGAASVGNAFEDLKNMAAGGGLEALVPLLEEIKASREAFNPENMGNMRNTVEELKSLMTEVRSLLDQEVNKPVVHGWLEEEQE